MGMVPNRAGNLRRRVGIYTVSSGNLAPNKKFFTSAGADAEAYKRAQDNPAAAHTVSSKKRGFISMHGSYQGTFDDKHNPYVTSDDTYGTSRRLSFNAEIPSSSPFDGTHY